MSDANAVNAGAAVLDLECPVCEHQGARARPQKLRDSEAIGVAQCAACGHVFLDSFAHIDDAYFERGRFLLDKPFIDGVNDRLRHYAAENAERAGRVGPLVVNKRVLDFGCGAGALMSALDGLARDIEGVEKTEPFRQYLTQQGRTVHEEIEHAEGRFDVVLMFHVLEHVPKPVDSLRRIAARLEPDGFIYLEVPNIDDALVSLYEVEAAERFAYFKDHLQYFSRTSLRLAIERAGLEVMGIWGHNRFSLANHLHWLSKGKPNGHKVWSFLETPSLAAEYAQVLAAAGLSDSLVAKIRVPA